jgi:hypothetical protein
VAAVCDRRVRHAIKTAPVMSPAKSPAIVVSLLAEPESTSGGVGSLFGLYGEFHEPAFVQGQFQVQ